MKTLFVFFMGVFSCASYAGPIADNFGFGFNGIKWGASIDTVIGVFPTGEHVFATTPGARAYSVKDDQPFLGVPRSGHSVFYGFGENDELTVVAISFPFERRDQLMGVLLTTFGATQSQTRGKRIFYRWPQEAGVQMLMVVSKDSKNGIVWLCIGTPAHPLSQLSSPPDSVAKGLKPSR